MTENAYRKQNEDTTQLLLLIAREISAAERKERQAGWTPWALLVGLAYLVWVFLGVIAEGLVDWKAVVALYMTLWIGLEAVKLVIAALSPAITPNVRSQRFFLSKMYFAQSRSYILAGIGHAAFVGFAVFMTGASLGRGQLVAWIFVAYIGVVYVVVFLLSLFPVPFPQVWPRIWVRVSVFVMAGFGLGTASVIISKIALGTAFAVSSWKAGVVLFGIGNLLMWLCQTASPPSSLHQELENIERRIVLSHIPYETAKLQVDHALRGLTLSTIMGPAMAAVIRESNRALSTLDEVARDVDALQQAARRLPDAPSPDTSPGAATVNALMHEIERKMNSIDGDLNSLRARVTRLARKLTWVEWIALESVSEVQDLRQDISDSIDQRVMRMVEIKTRLQEIQECFERRMGLSPN